MANEATVNHFKQSNIFTVLSEPFLLAKLCLQTSLVSSHALLFLVHTPTYNTAWDTSLAAKENNSIKHVLHSIYSKYSHCVSKRHQQKGQFLKDRREASLLTTSHVTTMTRG